MTSKYSPPPPYNQNDYYTNGQNDYYTNRQNNYYTNGQNDYYTNGQNDYYTNGQNDYSQDCNTLTVNVNNMFSHYIPNVHSHRSQPKVKKYHGPIVNTQPVFKVSTKYHNIHKGTTKTNVDYVNVNNIDSSNCYIDQNQLNRNVRLPGLSPMPVEFIAGNSRLSRDEYFREQERVLKNRHTEELLKLESQRVYTNLINR